MAGYTQTQLPDVDKVEVLALHGLAVEVPDESERVVGRPYQILSISVEGELAEKIAALWRHLPMKGPQAKCHHPIFGLRSFSYSALVLEASLCYDCHNLLIQTDGERFLRAFRSDDTTYAQKLLKIMQMVMHDAGETLP